MNQPDKKKKEAPTNYMGRDYEALKKEAQILYIKQGLSLEAIHNKLEVSMVSLSKWRKLGNWDDLRPDLEILKEYKAAGMYIADGLTIGEICQRLSVPEVSVKFWIRINRWDAAKLVYESKGVVSQILAPFNSHFKTLFPHLKVEVDFACQDYLKSITPLKH